MRVRLLAATGGIVVLGSLLAGCGLAIGGTEEAEGAAHRPGVGDRGEEEAERAVDDEYELVIVDNGAEVREDCANREVVVTADDAHVVLDGACGLVKATGRGTTVNVGSADKIVLVGVDNEVAFASGDPEVINHGRNTTVVEGGSAGE
ncbi:DUF3060 domain-containing protein [Nocardiopsis aegyptia]|uniref:DUF3060 domain-containing protein n=1 Tax=Nocardiopsis aegyptia TaxID=220378 RepID=A0A7Z0J976_9ACTN|nr:DUF3060 domain-containing protein [Nocardiopsis aegyptia]NYJ33214.1 hypothetical protein [Nocardiopsis aegyptia]